MFEVGDKVWSERFGIGEVLEEGPLDVLFPIAVSFGHDTEVFTLKGTWLSQRSGWGDIVPYTGQDKKQTTPTIADRAAWGGCWDTEIPAHVRRHLLGNMEATIAYHTMSTGCQVSIGEADYARLDELREAVEWFVEQLGGNVTWEEK